jgi:hypothetical protein
MRPYPHTPNCPKTSLIVAMIALFGAGLPADADQAAGGAGTTSPVKVKVPTTVAAKANAPTPPAKATKKASIGKGKATAKTANAADDQDSFWVEEIDIDGDGDVESTDVVWDDEDKVLFLYSEGDFACSTGGEGDGDMLIAVNGQGNPRGRAAGSGWYVVTLDESECKAKTADAFGCKFDAAGIETACGAAVIDEKNDDVVITTASN